MSKTQRQQPSNPKPELRQIKMQEKRRKMWQAAQPPLREYPQREVLPWKVEG